MGHRTELSLAVQALALRSSFPTSAPHLQNGRLEWRHQIQPSDATDEYLLRLDARVGRAPDVFVDSPVLVTDADGRLPHVYPSGALCVNRIGEWRPTMLFIDTVIPWAIEWLFYYELWLTSGCWYGDGDEALTAERQRAILHPYGVASQRP